MTDETISGSEAAGSALDSQPKLIEVAAGLVFRNGLLLITQRPSHSHLGGLWEFPGGKREAGETFEYCVRRELQEELGIDVEVGELIESITHHYPDKAIFLKFFRCNLRQNEPCALSCGAFAWVAAPELRNYVFPAADERLLERLAASPELWRAGA